MRDDLAVTYNAYPPSAYAPPRDPTAVVGRRIVAFLIDAIILGVIAYFALQASLTRYDKDGVEFLDVCDRVEASVCWEDDNDAFVFETDEDVFVGVAIPVLAWLSNLVILQGMTGATVGKFALGLRVVNKQGGNAGVGRSLVRSLFLVIDSACLYLPGLITMLTTSGHRRIGDLVGGTYVVGAQDAANGVAPVPGAYVPISASQPGQGWVPPDVVPSGAWTPPPPSGPPPAPPPAASPPGAAPPGSPYNAPPPSAPPSSPAPPPPADEPPEPSSPW